ncbi:MAG: hypothetical protein ABMA64_37495, partial [Myxococcota bacterium]
GGAGWRRPAEEPAVVAPAVLAPDEAAREAAPVAPDVAPEVVSETPTAPPVVPQRGLEPPVAPPVSTAPAADPPLDPLTPEPPVEVARTTTAPEAAVEAPWCVERLDALARAAGRGKLDPDAAACLDQVVSAPGPQRAAASRLLMVDAWSRPDRGAWEARAKRHLQEVDPSDPELPYQLALYLVGEGPARAEEAAGWAERGLAAPRDASTRATLEKVRASAYQQVWAEAERVGDERRAAWARELTAGAAREWAANAITRGENPSVALELCRAADPTCSVP